MKTTLAIIASLALASCTTVTAPDGSTTQTLSPLGEVLIIKAAERILDKPRGAKDVIR